MDRFIVPPINSGSLIKQWPILSELQSPKSVAVIGPVDEKSEYLD
jgi:hypothetical protein